MQKYRKLIVLFILAIVVIAGWFIYAFFANQPPMQIPKLPGFIRVMEDEVLVIDMNANDNPSIYDAFNTRDSLVVLHTDPNPNQHKNDKIQSQLLLSDIGMYNHARLGPKDPFFNNLQLMTYNGANGQVQFVPIYQAGIRVIYLDLTSSLGKSLPLSTNMLPRPVGTVILSDGSARLIREMMVDENYLQPVLNH